MIVYNIITHDIIVIIVILHFLRRNKYNTLSKPVNTK